MPTKKKRNPPARAGSDTNAAVVSLPDDDSTVDDPYKYIATTDAVSMLQCLEFEDGEIDEMLCHPLDVNVWLGLFLDKVRDDRWVPQ